MTIQRQSLDDIGPERLVNRTQESDQVVNTCRRIRDTATNIRDSNAVSTNEGRDRLIVVKGGTGVGKTIFLQMLGRRISTENIGRTVGPISIKNLVDANDDPELDANFLSALIACAGVNIAGKDLSECSRGMTGILKKAGTPVCVFLDDLEALNNPLFQTGRPNRDIRVLNVKNHLLRPLLTLLSCPVIIIAAVRAMPDEEMPYLSEIDFQDALYEVRIENTEADVNTVLGINKSDSRTEQCGDSLLVAAERGPSWDDAKVKRELVEEFMDREHPVQRAAFENMLTALSKQPVVTPADIKAMAADLLPSELQKRTTARLKATGYLLHTSDANGLNTGYRVYPPLANLLRSL